MSIVEKLPQILAEAGFKQVSAICRFSYDNQNSSLGAEKLAEIVRAVPGSTRVSTVNIDKDKGQIIFNVKIITSKSATEAFRAFKRNILKKYGKFIRSVEIGAGSIEVKDSFIVTNALHELKQKYIKEYNLA